MKIAIDFSILTRADGAYGNVVGEIDLDVAPQPGDIVSFTFPKVSGLAKPEEFTDMLRVKERIFSAGAQLNVSLVLEDMLLTTFNEAPAVAEYLEKGFGLKVNPNHG